MNISSEGSPSRPGSPNRIRRRSGLERREDADPPHLDEIDIHLLDELALDARRPNKVLAAAVGIAPSTCLARVRRLRDTGVIRGFHADIDPALTGRSLQAMVAVRMQPHARSRLSKFQRQLADLPGVLNVFLLGSTHDFFVHVAAPDSDALNAFVVDNLSTDRDVASTETSVIFRHVRSARFS